MKASARSSDPWWMHLPWAQVALAMGYTSWFARYPEVRIALVTLARSAVMAAGAGGLLWMCLKPDAISKEDEDDFAHYSVVGLSRSGKTAWAILKVLEWHRRGWGWCWLSVKGGRGLLPFLPSASADIVDLISPTSARPRGINMLRLASGAPAEREQVADQTADLIDRLHPASSDLMREMLRAGTLALLEFGVAAGREVGLSDLYQFFQSEDTRQQVLARVPLRPIRDVFDGAVGTQRTLEAVQRQVRRLVGSRSVFAALGCTGPAQVDIRRAMASGRGVVVDASDSDLGPGHAALINEVIASKVQLLTAQRTAKDPGFGVIADEVQEYQGAGHAFRRALALAAEYRVSWALINQFREGQLNPAMQAATGLAGTQVFFRLAPGDAALAVKLLAGKTDMESLVQLHKRHFYTVERCRGVPRIYTASTPDLPVPDAATATLITRRNETGPTAAQLLKEVSPSRDRGGRRLWA